MASKGSLRPVALPSPRGAARAGRVSSGRSAGCQPRLFMSTAVCQGPDERKCPSTRRDLTC